LAAAKVQIVGSDGNDHLANIEYAQFNDQDDLDRQ